MSAIVLLSGGQDSVTCLAWAKSRHGDVHALTINYGQRHAVELECAKKAAEHFHCLSHTVIDIPSLFPQGISAMNSLDVDVKLDGNAHNAKLPTTFLPGRNLVFLAIAASHASAHKCKHIVTGVCETDFSGYPDCRQVFITDMEFAICAALGDSRMLIHTPLMTLDKAATFALARSLCCLDFVIEHSHTCYMGNHDLLHEWGYGCGECPSCTLRKNGWNKYVASL